MHKLVAITDLTRMQGQRVCVAGYLPGDRCVRPVLPDGGLLEPWLYLDRSPIIRPFAVVELDLLEECPEPPHTEDWVIDPDYRSSRAILSPERRLRMLQRILDPSVASIFSTPLERSPGWFVLAGTGDRSLGTIRARHVERVFYEWGTSDLSVGERWNYHLELVDATGQHYNLAVTDLVFRYFLDELRIRHGLAPRRAAQRLTTSLQHADVFLRIGLARGWKRYPERCYLQITGVYSFPDYLDGRCFADFAPAATEIHDVPSPDYDVPW